MVASQHASPPLVRLAESKPGDPDRIEVQMPPHLVQTGLVEDQHRLEPPFKCQMDRSDPIVFSPEVSAPDGSASDGPDRAGKAAQEFLLQAWIEAVAESDDAAESAEDGRLESELEPPGSDVQW